MAHKDTCDVHFHVHSPIPRDLRKTFNSTYWLLYDKWIFVLKIIQAIFVQTQACDYKLMSNRVKARTYDPTFHFHQKWFSTGGVIIICMWKNWYYDDNMFKLHYVKNHRQPKCISSVFIDYYCGY